KRRSEMSVFLSEVWMQSLKSELNSDRVWSESSKYFSARVAFRSDDTTGTLDIRDGFVVSAIAAAHPLGADITITGPAREWKRVEVNSPEFRRHPRVTFSAAFRTRQATAFRF